MNMKNSFGGILLTVLSLAAVISGSFSEHAIAADGCGKVMLFLTKIFAVLR